MVQGNYSSSELRNFSARIPSIKYLLKIIRVFQIAQPLKCFNVVFLFVSFFCKTTWICCATIPRLNIRKIILSLCNILESVYSPQLISELERILWSINLWNQKKKKKKSGNILPSWKEYTLNLSPLSSWQFFPWIDLSRPCLISK